MQYTGFSPTTELDAFRGVNLARNVNDFKNALQRFDLGGQHFIYADRTGTIAYFTNAEVPIREDLQAGKVQGNPPYLLRNGTGGNGMAPGCRNRQPQQSLPYEIVPFAEMPQTVNPPAGFIVSANNDPHREFLRQRRPQSGPSGRRRLLPRLCPQRIPAGRITEMVRAAVRKGGITRADVVRMQADTTTIEGPFFTPVIAKALARARTSSTTELAKLAKDPRIVEAVGRLGRWNDAFTRRGSLRASTVATAMGGGRCPPRGRSTRAWRPRSMRSGEAGSSST